MLDIGKFYLFQPPFSESEHFVEVTSVKNRETPEGAVQYVHYKHVMSDVDGSIERTYFERGSYEITLSGVEQILDGIENEIEDLRSKHDHFNQLREILLERSEQTSDSNDVDEAKDFDDVVNLTDRGYSVESLVGETGETKKNTKTKRVVIDNE